MYAAKRIFWMGALASTLLLGCSDDEKPAGAAEGGACTIDSDCQSGLLCRGQVCITSTVNPDGGNNANNNNGSDAGTNNGGTNNNGVVITDEDYYISYRLEDSFSAGEVELRIFDTESEEDTKLNPDGLDCARGCWISSDLSKFVWVTTNTATAGTFDVHSASVTNLVVGSEDETIATAVRKIRVVQNVVTYVKEEGLSEVAYLKPLDGSPEVLVGTVGSTMATGGSWFVDPSNDVGVLYTADLQTMDIHVGPLGTAIDPGLFIYKIDSSNYQAVSGSYFGGDVASAISGDGKVLALLTQKAPMDYNACSDVSQCTGPGQRCGRFDRCSAIEIVVHFVDLENTDKLGTTCGGDSDCGPIQMCDIPSNTQLDQAKCVPRRVVLGLPGEQQQGTPQRRGCELTDGNDAYHYTQVRSPLSFAPDGALYAVAARDCGDLNIQDTDLLRIEPATGEIEVAWGNPNDEDFSDARCYDEVEGKIDVTDCIVHVQNAILSPGGNDVAMLATNPNVVDPGLAGSSLDLWRVRRDGQNHEWLGKFRPDEGSQSKLVSNLAVHAKP